MMINGLPTIHEVVTSVTKKPTKEKTTKINIKNSKSGSKVTNFAVLKLVPFQIGWPSNWFQSFDWLRNWYQFGNEGN
jgi:hypothetical protein